MAVIIKFFVVFSCLVGYVCGHGMMLDPVGRASRWRYDETAPVNTEDNELFCGGITVTWQENNGKCGICGDDYALPTPRPHEIGGEYGSGEIVKSYTSGNEIPITIEITANHKGYFTFDICNMDVSDETDDCFKKLRLGDGSDRYWLQKTNTGFFYTSVFIPRYMTCDHCVLRWQYTAANMWGACGNGTSAVGCGPQEIYRSCADISIKDAGPRLFSIF